MGEPVVIYGKDTCPYTTRAREAYAKEGPIRYLNVKSDPAKLEEMLRRNGGDRRVPTIVIGDKVTVGYGGT